jgi:hypothetical protein
VLTVRRVWVVFVGAWIASWTTNALFDWILGLDGTPLLVINIVAAVLGALVGVVAAQDVEPWTLWDERDAYLGWVTFFGVVAVIACLFAPMPWGLMAAAVVAALTLVVLRRAPPVPPG